MTFEEWLESNPNATWYGKVPRGSMIRIWMKAAFEGGQSSNEEDSKKMCLITRGYRSFEEWRKSTLPTWTDLGDTDAWMRRAFEAGRTIRGEKEPEYLTADQLTEPGYYWWLPECDKDQSDKPECWGVRVWHPKDSTRPRSGLFVGPLKAPVKRKEATNEDVD